MLIIIIRAGRRTHSPIPRSRKRALASAGRVFTLKLYLYQRLWVSCRFWAVSSGRGSRYARGICFGPAGHCSSSGVLSLRGALSRFIHKRGGGAGGGGGARRPVESWRCSRDEVMLVDCWEPAMGIKVMKGHMQKRGESTIGIRNRRRFF